MMRLIRGRRAIARFGWGDFRIGSILIPHAEWDQHGNMTVLEKHEHNHCVQVKGEDGFEDTYHYTAFSSVLEY